MKKIIVSALLFLNLQHSHAGAIGGPLVMGVGAATVLIGSLGGLSPSGGTQLAEDLVVIGSTVFIVGGVSLIALVATGIGVGSTALILLNEEGKEIVDYTNLSGLSSSEIELVNQELQNGASIEEVKELAEILKMDH